MRRLIPAHNPWWAGKSDATITKWELAKIKWFPKWVRELSLEPFSLNFVVGPRQIGKTTGVKLLIRELSEKVAPESIFYFNCDFLPDLDSLKKLLDTYLEFKESEGITTAFVFLDEITSVKEWWRVVKGYIDLGIFEKTFLHPMKRDRQVCAYGR